VAKFEFGKYFRNLLQTLCPGFIVKSFVICRKSQPSCLSSVYVSTDLITSFDTLHEETSKLEHETYSNARKRWSRHFQII